MTETIIEVVGGVDADGDTHHAAVMDIVGRVLGSLEFSATGNGYAKLFEWMSGFGRLELVGVEGTGTYGVGLCLKVPRFNPWPFRGGGRVGGAVENWRGAR